VLLEAVASGDPLRAEDEVERHVMLGREHEDRKSVV